jgi:E3 Ubiquitin ligase
VTVYLSFVMASNNLTTFSLFAMVGGLYFFFYGFRLLARKRLLLGTPTSRIRSAAMGLVEINGVAAGPYTMPAPITGKPCFLYNTTAWRQREGKKQEWEKVADETLHLPFFVDDSTGKMLIEPLGADLDLVRDFHEEYTASFFSSNLNDVPPRVSIFLSRHSIAPGHRMRIEERSIKPADSLFIAGTLTENPGIQVRGFSPTTISQQEGGGSRFSASLTFLKQATEPQPAPEIIKLSGGAGPATTQEMSQQAKIVAALTRAGITRPEAWSAAGVPYQGIAVEEMAASDVRRPDPQQIVRPDEGSTPKSSDFDLSPPVVLMKGENDPTFIISFRSQKEFVRALAWKSAAMIWGGAAITLLGLYTLLAQMEWL